MAVNLVLTLCSGPGSAVRACRHRERDLGRGLGQCAAADGAAAPARPFRARPRARRRVVPRIAGGGLGMGAAAVGRWTVAAGARWLGVRWLVRLVALAALVGGGLAVFACLALVFGVAAWREAQAPRLRPGRLIRA